MLRILNFCNHLLFKLNIIFKLNLVSQDLMDFESNVPVKIIIYNWDFASNHLGTI